MACAVILFFPMFLIAAFVLSRPRFTESGRAPARSMTLANTPYEQVVRHEHHHYVHHEHHHYGQMAPQPYYPAVEQPRRRVVIEGAIVRPSISSNRRALPPG